MSFSRSYRRADSSNPRSHSLSYRNGRSRSCGSALCGSLRSCCSRSIGRSCHSRRMGRSRTHTRRVRSDQSLRSRRRNRNRRHSRSHSRRNAGRVSSKLSCRSCRNGNCRDGRSNRRGNTRRKRSERSSWNGSRRYRTRWNSSSANRRRYRNDNQVHLLPYGRRGHPESLQDPASFPGKTFTRRMAKRLIEYSQQIIGYSKKKAQEE